MTGSLSIDSDPGRLSLLLQPPRLAYSQAGRMKCLYPQPLNEAETEGEAGDFLKRWPRSATNGQIAGLPE